MTNDQQDDDENSTWVRSEPSADGKTYVVTLSAGSDHSIVLDRYTALNYALYVHDAVERARYDAAVRKQLVIRLKLGEKEVAQVILDLRRDRPEQQHDWPIKIIPGVSQRDGHPFLRLEMPDGKQGQWEIDDAISHANGVLEASIVADLDAGYYRILRGAVGVEEHIARNVIDDLANHR